MTTQSLALLLAADARAADFPRLGSGHRTPVAGSKLRTLDSNLQGRDPLLGSNPRTVQSNRP